MAKDADQESIKSARMTINDDRSRTAVALADKREEVEGCV